MSFAIKRNQELWGWGDNTYGQLGNNTITSYSSPVLISTGNHTFIVVIGSHDHTVALKANGSAWTWGRNDRGQLGDNTTTDKSSPILVVGSHSFTKICEGYYHSIALKADGSAWAWGYNNYGQLGDNTVINKSSPVIVIGNHSFIEIDCGQHHSLALKADGSVWGWGYNNYGQIGNDNINKKSSPVLIVGNHSFINISTYKDFSAAKKADGTAWTWGYNNYGQLGSNEIYVYKKSPIEVIGNHSFNKIVAGFGHVLTLKANGETWAWGHGGYGQLGDSSIFKRSSPVLTIGSHSFIKITAGHYHSIALKSNGNVFTWGNNEEAQLGHNNIGYATNKSSPVIVVGSHSFTEISSGSFHSLALKANGEVWCWGKNLYGELGDDTIVRRSSPVLTVGNHSFIKIAGGYWHSVAIKANGEIWAWGSNTYYQLGTGNKIDSSSPVLVIGNHSFTEVVCGQAYSIALKADGSVWCWGANSYGELGDNTLTRRSSPTLVVGNHSFVEIGNGQVHSFARKSNGEVWAWGWNLEGFGFGGQLGDNTLINKSSPVLVVGSHSFIELATGKGNFSAVLKFSGSAWTWGMGESGQLGNYFNLNESSPIAVVGSHSFTKITTGDNHTVALKEDNTVWIWGRNNYYQLGNSTSSSSKASPVQIITNNSFVDINVSKDHALAIKQNGSIYGWGKNDYGNLGDNTIINKIPVTAVTGDQQFISLTGEEDITLPFVETLSFTGESTFISSDIHTEYELVT